MQAYLASLFPYFRNAFIPLAIMASICMALELILPKRRYSLWSYVRGVRNAAIYFAVAAIVWKAFYEGLAKLGLKPLLTVNFAAVLHSNNQVLGTAAAVLCGVVVAICGDFFYYWQHRTQHAVPFLWRLHSVHHSIRELTTWNSNHHISEPVISALFISIPLTLIHFDSGVVPATALTLITFQGHLSHSSTRLHLGWLRYVVGDNRFHRIHHSLERRHWNKNYGFFTTVWDSLFGTAIWPTKGEWPDVGLEDQTEAGSVRDYVLRPFVKLSPDIDGTVPETVLSSRP
jgi:sterol desaturase/sphingolipid hydroxylase (fatty acid hydroxylase superfamily)